MSIDNFKDKFFNFTRGFANKTEEYAKITKLNLEIKKISSDIEKKHTELGEAVFNLREEGKDNISLNEGTVLSISQEIIRFQGDITAKKDQIEKIKSDADITSEDIEPQGDVHPEN